MMLIDANLLLEAHVKGPRHAAARKWLDEQLWGTVKVGIPWQSLLAFLRIVTNSRVYARPETMTGAWAQVEDWLACGPVWIPEPTEEHPRILKSRLTRGWVVANLVPEAHLAALAIGHGLTLYSLDADFARFPELRWKNPLVH